MDVGVGDLLTREHESGRIETVLVEAVEPVVMARVVVLDGERVLKTAKVYELPSEPLASGGVVMSINGKVDPVQIAEAVKAHLDHDRARIAKQLAPPSATQMLKASAAQRFTLAPWYIPDKYDSQNEWTDAVELQKGLWDYVKSGDRKIRLQHTQDANVEHAGEWVEAITLPYEWTVPMYKSNGAVGEVTYPAGTVLLGVVWEPWAWEMVEKGEITGFSIGGAAERIEMEMPSVAKTAVVEPAVDVATPVADAATVQNFVSSIAMAVTEAMKANQPIVNVVMPKTSRVNRRVVRDEGGNITGSVEEIVEE